MNIKSNLWPGMVAHTCSPSYWDGRIPGAQEFEATVSYDYTTYSSPVTEQDPIFKKNKIKQLVQNQVETQF